MAGTQHTAEYRALVRALVEMRHRKGLSQTNLAERVGRNRSFIAKVEVCERRLDVVEFCIWVAALEEDPSEFVRNCLSDLPSRMPRSPRSTEFGKG